MPDNSYTNTVYMQQGATALVVASGGTISIEPGGVINGLSNGLPGNLASGSIPLGSHLFSARELASAENFASGSSAPTAFWMGVLGPDTTPAMSIVSTGDQSFFLNWASANVDTIRLPPIAIPADLSTAGGLTIELFGEVTGSASAADAVQAFAINVWSGIGGANLGTTHPNFTTTPSYKGITIASGSIVPNAPLNISLTPQTHAARPIRLFDARIRYRKSS